FDTIALSINNARSVTGFYYDVSGFGHGFIRAADGTMTEVDAPGADFTNPFGINGNGDLTGFFDDSKGVHGFLRTADGTFTSFDVPGESQTYAEAINRTDVIAGYANNGHGSGTGFVRAADGTVTTFDPSGSTSEVDEVDPFVRTTVAEILI